MSNSHKLVLAEAVGPRKYAVTYAMSYEGLPINTVAAKDLGCFVHDLGILLRELTRATELHSKVLVLRFDIHFPFDWCSTITSSYITQFIHNFTRCVKYSCGGRNAGYVRFFCTKEQHENSPHPHYHCALIMNGNARNKHWPIIETASRCWQHVLGIRRDGLVHCCCKDGLAATLIDRNNSDYYMAICQAFYQLSYLAKVRGKNCLDKYERRLRCSYAPRVRRPTPAAPLAPPTTPRPTGGGVLTPIDTYESDRVRVLAFKAYMDAKFQ
jgi:hypothetical protein